MMISYYGTNMNPITAYFFKEVLGDNYRIHGDGDWKVESMQLQSGDVTLRVWIDRAPPQGMLLRAHWPAGHSDCEFKWQETHQHSGWAADFTLNEYMLPYGPYWIELAGPDITGETVDRIGMMHASEAWPDVNHIHADIWFSSPEGEENGMPYELVDFGPLNMHTHFREAGVQIDESAKYSVTHLIAKGGGDKPFPFEMVVRKKNGSPAPGVVLKLKKHGGAGGVWSHTTDGDGRVTIFMDDIDFKYAVPGKPKYCIHVGKGAGGSDVVTFGWVAGERRWFDVIFQARGGEPTEMPGKPVLSDLNVGMTEFYVAIVSEGADSLHYTLDGPGYHKDGEAGESALYRSDLQPSTSYALKIWGRNTAGDSPDTELAFTTLDEAPGEVPSPVTDLRVSYTTRITLTLQWDTSAGARVYRVETNGHEYSTSLTSYIIAGLLPDTTYTMSVAAGNEHGWSEWSTTSGKTQPEQGSGCQCGAELEDLGVQLNEIKAVVEVIKEGQDELAVFIQQKMTVAAEELPKVVAELERISGECRE